MQSAPATHHEVVFLFDVDTTLRARQHVDCEAGAIVDLVSKRVDAIKHRLHRAIPTASAYGAAAFQ